MGYATDELWAFEWENGGTPPWQAPERYEQFNPIDHVAQWQTPMLIVHSDRDFRIPLDQGLGAFSALQRKGVPSEFLQFSDEGHRVVRPQDLLQWHKVVKAWLDRWIGDQGSAGRDASAGSKGDSSRTDALSSRFAGHSGTRSRPGLPWND